MPAIGEVKGGKEIGYKNNGGRYVWLACSQCGRERWVNSSCTGKPHFTGRCALCSIRRNRYGRYVPIGGVLIGGQGYINVKADPKSPYFPMANKGGYIKQHRLAMAESLGRCLSKLEHVHHLNGVRDDNQIENLMLISRANHALYNKVCRSCPLRKEVRLLKRQVIELSAQLQNKLELEEIALQNVLCKVEVKMRTREIVRRIRKWRDFYGGDIPDVPEVRTKEQARQILEGHRRLMEETLSDAMSHLNDFERELGLY